MKKLLISLLIALSVSANAQKHRFFYFLTQGTPAVPRVTQYPQDRPTLTTPQTRASSGLLLAGSIFPGDLTGRHVILSGAFTGGAALNGITGDPGNPFIFTNEDASTLIGTTSNSTNAIGALNGTNYIELWGKDKDTPLQIRAGSGQSGIQFNPIVGGGVYRVYNVSAADIGYSTLLYSAPSSGGSYYKKNAIAWLARNGLDTEGEHIYLGHVSTETIFEENVLLHNSGIDMGREAIQIKWAERSRVYNNTFKNIGQVADAAQQHAFQIEVSSDTRFYDNIFDGAKRSINLFTHDLIVKGGVIRWTSSDGYIGNAATFWPGNPKLNGLKVLFDGVTFIRDISGNGYVAQWEETGCDLEFINCRFSDNILSSIVDDNRGGSPTNTLTGTTTTNGNTSVAKATLLAELPTYLEEADETDKDFMAVPTDNYYFIQGAGKGTPTKRTIEILDAKESVDTTVVFGTVYGDLLLPTVTPVLLSSGYWVNAPVSWSGSYDGDVADDYILTGTLSGYSNTDGLSITKTITVDVEPPDYKVILISLKGTGSSPYVGSGNWNHVAQSYSTGVQTITGDNSGSTLASLRDTGGSLTGYGVNIVTQFEGNDTRGMNSAGAYPANANRAAWENPGSNGTSRSFKFTGLDNAKPYTFKIVSSLDTFFNCSIDVTVSGASGGGTAINDYNGNSNVNTVFTFDPVYPTSGEVTITVLKNSGQAAINVIEINYED